MSLFGIFIVKFLTICCQNLPINLGKNFYFSSKRVSEEFLSIKNQVIIPFIEEKLDE
jgi:CRISPR/Cas system CSM-associated protein Csm4 (group 5 of RAMP superfamily)